MTELIESHYVTTLPSIDCVWQSLLILNMSSITNSCFNLFMYYSIRYLYLDNVRDIMFEKGHVQSL